MVWMGFGVSGGILSKIWPIFLSLITEIDQNAFLDILLYPILQKQPPNLTKIHSHLTSKNKINKFEIQSSYGISKPTCCHINCYLLTPKIKISSLEFHMLSRSSCLISDKWSSTLRNDFCNLMRNKALMLRLEHLRKRFACIFKCITVWYVGCKRGLRDSTLIFSPSTPSHHVCAHMQKREGTKYGMEITS